MLDAMGVVWLILLIVDASLDKHPSISNTIEFPSLMLPNRKGWNHCGSRVTA